MRGQWAVGGKVVRGAWSSRYPAFIKSSAVLPDWTGRTGLPGCLTLGCAHAMRDEVSGPLFALSPDLTRLDLKGEGAPA